MQKQATVLAVVVSAAGAAGALGSTGSATGSAKVSELGTVKRGAGTQVTYGGHPLYAFVADKKPGQVNGQGLNLSGNLWYAVSPSGTAMRASSKSSSSSSGGGSAPASW